MAYKQHEKLQQDVVQYFAELEDHFEGVPDALQNFFDDPCMDKAREVMRLYFKGHTQGDIEPLNKIASAFADKRSVLAIVDSLIDDDKMLDYVSDRSYPHPIGFDKLVLYHDPDTNFKFRLHIYWRGQQRHSLERLHLHRFEMASAIISGELTNHTWGVTEFTPSPEQDIVPAMTLNKSDATIGQDTQQMEAYSGYWRDANGVLHKKHLGSCALTPLKSDTHVSGQSYAQILEDAHYVETNAETGLGNGDVCSTIYIHSGGLADEFGRSLPVLFEENELENPDEIISTIPNLDVESLKEKLGHYRDFLASNIEFYDWLYDEKHGRNLSTGMIAGYLLAEHYNNPHILSVWIEHEKNCKAVLREHEPKVKALVQGEISLDDISDDNRNKRYYAMLLKKAEDHPQGKEYWLQHYGNLVNEMWRYCGAIKGEQPDVTLLKSIWEESAGAKLPGGAHYGHIAAMLEAAYEAKDMALEARRDGVSLTFKSKHEVVSEVDKTIEDKIKDILLRHYPNYGFKGEEGGEMDQSNPQEGDKRFLVDPIDGTKNYGSGLDDFATSIACQEFRNGQWETTDGVVSVPASGKIFWAEKDYGAFVIDGDDREYRIQPHQQDAVANDYDPMSTTLLNYSIRGFGHEAEKQMMDFVIDNHIGYRVTGCAATMLTMSAQNDNNASVITANDYDVAAGVLIAQEAGATVRTIDFQRDGQNFNVTFAARNPSVISALDAQITKVLQPYPPEQTALPSPI